MGESAVSFNPGLEDDADQQEPHSTYLAVGGREGSGLIGDVYSGKNWREEFQHEHNRALKAFKCVMWYAHD